MTTLLAPPDTEDLFSIEELETRETPGSWTCGCSSSSCSCTSCCCVYSW